MIKARHGIGNSINALASLLIASAYFGGAETDWHRFLKKWRRHENDYFFFSIRMMAYGFVLLFLALFFLIEWSQESFSSSALAYFYLTAVILITILMVYDVNKFKNKRVHYSEEEEQDAR